MQLDSFLPFAPIRRASRVAALAALAAPLLLAVGCSPWPPSGPVSSQGASGPGGATVTLPPPAAPTWTLILPTDGAPQGDGTVSASVVDTNGSAIGSIDFFTSEGEPIQDAAGAWVAPDALVTLFGAEAPDVAESPQDSRTIDLDAAELTPGASTSAQAGALVFTLTVEQVSTEEIDGVVYFNPASLVIEVEVSLA